ncbi:MAG: pyruvate kinase [Bacilli bacterium]|nr:pyruvate kinase [Bacilli bacterium]
MKKTKIICSIGPSSCEADVMEQMVLAGMNIARFNFSHMTDEERNKNLESVGIVREKTGKNIAILWDTKGPEFRSGKLEGESIELVEGNTIRLVKEDVLGNQERITVNHPEALDSLEVGTEVLLENAKMKIEVISKEEDGVTCKIVNGGVLGNRKSLSVPGVKLNIPYLSDDDRNDIRIACENGGEYIAASFVSCKEDVEAIRELCHENGRDDFLIISKIESDLGIKNINEILEVSDGIMVARGDMGNEIPSARIPVVQKALIKAARKAGKICVVATEMLETMMGNFRPKRAETSDIANAVLDGTDCVMLSGETTVGQHPIETVAAMANICETTEQYAKFNYVATQDHVDTVPGAIAECVVESSNRLGGKVIVASTISGFTARLISNLKPNAPILALVPDQKTACQLAANWGVEPVILPICNSTDEVITKGVEAAKNYMPLVSGDKIIVTGSFPNTGESRPTNLMKIEEVE